MGNLIIGQQISQSREPIEVRSDDHLEEILDNPWIGQILEEQANLYYDEYDECYYQDQEEHCDSSCSSNISLNEDLRRRHIYILGASGSGKSEMLRYWISQDIKAGRGLGVFDPNSLLIKKILNDISVSKLPDDKLIVVVPHEIQESVAFNPLEIPQKFKADENYIDKLVSEIFGIFAQIWKETGWGQRMEDLLYNSLYLLAENNYTLVEMPDLLLNQYFREVLLDNCSNLFVKKYWLYEFNPLSEAQRSQWVAPVLNRIRAFIRPTMVRNIVGQRQSTIDFEKIVNQGYILLVDLNPAMLGHDNASLLGALLIAKLRLAAFRRNLNNPRPWTLYVDEFQDFLAHSTSENFATILSQARKYNLNLVMAHQDLAQIKRRDPYLVSSILTNTATQIIFSANHNDAKLFSDQLPRGEDEVVDYVELRHIFRPKTLAGEELYNPRGWKDMTRLELCGEDGSQACIMQELRGMDITGLCPFINHLSREGDSFWCQERGWHNGILDLSCYTDGCNNLWKKVREKGGYFAYVYKAWEEPIIHTRLESCPIIPYRFGLETPGGQEQCKSLTEEIIKRYIDKYFVHDPITDEITPLREFLKLCSNYIIQATQHKLLKELSTYLPTGLLFQLWIYCEPLHIDVKVHYKHDTKNTGIINQILKLEPRQALCKVQSSGLKLMQTIDTPQAPINIGAVAEIIKRSNGKYATEKREIEKDMIARLERFYKTKESQEKPQGEKKNARTKAPYAPKEDDFFEIE